MLIINKDVFKRDILTEIMQFEDPIGDIDLQLSDKVVSIPVREFLLNYMFWRIYDKFNMTIDSTMVYIVENLTRDSIASIHTDIYNRILKYHGQIHTVDPMLREAILKAIWDFITEFSNFAMIWCVEYCSSMDLISVGKIMMHPKVRKIYNDINFDIRLGTDKAEASINEASAKLIKLIESPGEIPNNVLQPFIRVNDLKKIQLPQFLLAYGTRADIDGHMMMHCIKTGAIEGLQNIKDFAVESLSLKKSMYFNASVIQNTAYMGRELHLACSNLSKIHAGDCGTTATYPFLITENNMNFAIGKYIVDPVTNKLVALHNYDDLENGFVDVSKFVGKTVNMRSPLLCRYTDGTCEKCGGRLSMFQDKRMHAGLVSAVEVWSKVPNMVLSSKHLNKSVSQLYQVPDTARRFLQTKGNNIAWSETINSNINKWTLVIPIDSISPLDDLIMSYSDNDSSDEENTIKSELPDPTTFTRNLNTVKLIYNKDSDNAIEVEFDMAYENFDPYLSSSALSFMKQKINQIEEIDGFLYIPLRGFNSNRHFFSYTIMNDDIPMYVKSVSDFFKSDSKIGQYTSISKLVEDFTNLLYQRVTPNLYHVELVLRAFLVISESDNRTPIVTNIDDIHCVNIVKAIQAKGISIKLAHERLREYFTQPSSYLNVVCDSVFDSMFGFAKNDSDNNIENVQVK